MKIKADDYFNNELFEMARFGKQTIMKNIMTPRQHQEYKKIMHYSYLFNISTICFNHFSINHFNIF